MRMHYSQAADAIYIRLKEDPIHNTDEVTSDIIMDYDEKGNVIGIEILSASEKVDVHEPRFNLSIKSWSIRFPSHDLKNQQASSTHTHVSMRDH